MAVEIGGPAEMSRVRWQCTLVGPQSAAPLVVKGPAGMAETG